MAKRLKYFVLALLLLPLAGTAQSDLKEISDARLLDMAVANLQQMSAIANLDSINPELAVQLPEHYTVLKQGAAVFSKEQDTDNPGFVNTLRAERHQGNESSAEVDGVAVEKSRQVLKNVSNGLSRVVDAKIGREAGTVLRAPVNELIARQLLESLEMSMERLRRFEIKYGPNSAQLNLLEAAVNHFLLRGIDAFGVDDAGNPGSLEMIMAYSSAYLNYDNDAKANNDFLLLSAAELGLRHYFFSKGWGKGNYLKPAYASFGALLASEKSGFLRNPFDGDAHWGAFLSWGDFKLAYTFGDDNRLLLSKQFQVIPFLF